MGPSMAMISLRVSQATFRLFTYWLVVHCTGGHMYTVTCTVRKKSSYVGKNQEVIYILECWPNMTYAWGWLENI